MKGFFGLIFLPIAVIGRLFVQTVLLALGQVWANKTRAMLTALGIILGVGSVIAVVGGRQGMRNYVLGEFASCVRGAATDRQRAVARHHDAAMLDVGRHRVRASADAWRAGSGRVARVARNRGSKRDLRSAAHADRL